MPRKQYQRDLAAAGEASIQDISNVRPANEDGTFKFNFIPQQNPLMETEIHVTVSGEFLAKSKKKEARELRYSTTLATKLLEILRLINHRRL